MNFQQVIIVRFLPCLNQIAFSIALGHKELVATTAVEISVFNADLYSNSLPRFLCTSECDGAIVVSERREHACFKHAYANISLF